MMMLWVALAFLVLVTSCNVVAWRRGKVLGQFRKAGLKRSQLELGKDTVEAWVGGDRTKPTVVLLHGFGPQAIWQWHNQLDALASRYRLVIPNLLWFGGSHSDLRDYSVAHQVHAVKRLLDQLGVKRVHLVGISYGGLVAYRVASVFPDRVAKLVLVDTPGPVYTWLDYKSLCRRYNVKSIGTVLIPRDPPGVKRLLELGYYAPPWTPGWALRQVLREIYSQYRHEKRELLKAVLQEIGKHHCRKLTAKTLVIWGQADDVFPIPIGRRLADCLKARFEVIERTKHAPNLERPRVFNRILRGFLQ